MEILLKHRAKLKNYVVKIGLFIPNYTLLVFVTKYDYKYDYENVTDIMSQHQQNNISRKYFPITKIHHIEFSW